jgi:tetratricopeptide (TPR) repeat protein
MKSLRPVLALPAILCGSLLALALPGSLPGRESSQPTTRLSLSSRSAALPADSRLGLPPDVLRQVHDGLDRIFHGDPDAAVTIARDIQNHTPGHPVGYLLETEAAWWKLYCQACGLRYNLIDAWSRSKLKQDDAYFALADRAIQLGETQIAQQESAPMHVFAGMGYGLKARLHGIRGEHLAVARSGVKGREHFLRALALDPQLGDALTGMGLYNYLADVLSPFAKMLRFFIGVPGGNKQKGIQQLETAMNTAELTAVEARFYLARNLRNFDGQYERGAELLEPLVARYPDNPVFQLLLGDMYAKLNRKDPAAIHFRAAQQIRVSDATCAARVQAVAAAALSAFEH